MPRKKDCSTYFFSDVLAIIATWICFFGFRKMYIEQLQLTSATYLEDSNFFIGLVGVIFYWTLLFLFTNTYDDIYKKSIVIEFFRTLLQSVVGSIFLFLIVMLNDAIHDYLDYYKLLLFYIVLHFCLLWIGRWAVLQYAQYQIKKKHITIATYLFYDEERSPIIPQNIFGLQHQIVQSFHIADTQYQQQLSSCEQVIIAVKKAELPTIEEIILTCLTNHIPVKILAKDFSVLSNHYKTQNDFDSDYIYINTNKLSPSQQISKRIVDLVTSFLLLVLLSPIFLLIAMLVKVSSKGTVIYQQQRIGKHGKPFTMYKFRTMIAHAENENQPQLTQIGDSRITTVGAYLRKFRLDELPQLYNILIGNMSWVGPRPEREFFLTQLLAKAPKYKLIQQLQPGITSLGMVKFGYAHTIEEMLQRMQYDLFYLDNRGLWLDIKIIMFTVVTVLKGKGK